MIDPRTPDFSWTPVAAGRPRFGYVRADLSAPPRVSIVTPFYNTGEVFRETALSVLEQSFQQWEWIIVNDASTNAEAVAILAEYRQRDPRIRIVDHAANQGPSASRNSGIRMAQTPYVVLLDSDDLLETTAIEKWFWHLATFPEHAFVKGFGVGFGALEYLWTRGFHDGAAFLEEHLVDVTSMIRRDVHGAVGGFDEETRNGLEDWEFWLRCAARGYWGSTVPEFLNWYRRRADHTDRWQDLSGTQRDAFRETLRRRYPHLWEGMFPTVTISSVSYARMPEDLPAVNLLVKQRPRLLLILPWLAMGGADKFNLDLVKELTHRGWEISIATTKEGDYSWLPVFSRATPDVFALPHFLRLEDYPRFLSYLISSRRIDVVLTSNSELGYKLLPLLRAMHPAVAFADYCHMEEEGWNSGGYPRLAVQYQEQIDLNIVSSEYLKGWMTRHGGDADRIEVCTTNIDTQFWRPDPEQRLLERAALGIPGEVPVILYPCRIAEQKQPRVFIETIRLVHRQYPAFVALVAGEGPDLPMMKQAAAESGLGEYVRFLGAVSNRRVHDLMTAADILFLPSKWEGIALTMFEAMASGLAVVGAAVGGQSELVVPGTGILTPPSSPEEEAREYARILLSLLGMPGQISQLQKAARDRAVRLFGIEQMGNRMASLCERAIRYHGDRPRPSVPVGLARSTAMEALEMQRNQPQRLWYAGITDAVQTILHAVHVHVNAGEYAIAGALLEPVREVFVGARDADRVAMLDAQIARVKALQVATEPAHAASEDDPLVTVVIPCFRQAEYLPEAMQSVLVQTYRSWEMIVVNDGSPDNTSELVREFQRSYPGHEIRLVEQPNRGLSAARNAGFAAARGAFVVPLDADDKIAPAFIARCVEEAATNERLGFVYTNLRHFGELHDVYELPAFDAETFVHKDNTATCCALIRLSMWKDVGGYNEQMREGYEDWDFWVGAIEKGWSGLRIPEPLFEYRIKHRSMLRDANARRPFLIARIVANHPALYDMRTRMWAEELLRKDGVTIHTAPVPIAKPLRIAYLIHNLLGVTGGNQTLLQQANALVERGHEVAIVSYSEPPEWMALTARVVRVHPGMSMAHAVPPSDVVIATYFLNALELPNIEAPVKIYFAQGDQFAFSKQNENQTATRMHTMSDASYSIPGVTVVANSRTLARRISANTGKAVDTILPVCVDRKLFRPIDHEPDGGPPRILIVGPDAQGTELEPLAFKGIGDIRAALEILVKEGLEFRVVRISSTPPEIFGDFPCDFHQAPDDSTKSRLYGTADLLVYASHYDSCPRPPLEAMAAGIAVVCTATDGAKEYCVDGENCLLVPVRSPESLAAAIRRLFNDRDLRNCLIQGGLATAETRPVEREWDELERLFGAETARVGLESPASATPSPGVSVVALMSGQRASEAQQFLEDLRGGIRGPYELILVDLHAGDEVVAWLKRHAAEPNVRVLLRSGVWDYARACNNALRVARGRLISVVRDGYRLPPLWCDALARFLDNNGEVGVVAPAVAAHSVRAAGAGERVCVPLEIQGCRYPLRTIPAACMMFRASLMAWAGVMNETESNAEREPAGFLYRALLTGSEAATIGDVELVPVGDDDTVERPALFRPSATPQVNPGDPMERLKRTVVIALDEARALEYADRVDEAVQRLRHEIDHFPESPALRSALAWLLLRVRRFEALSALIGETPESVKRNPQWLLIAGYAMEGLNELALARQCAEKALEVNPNTAPAHLLLGMLAIDEGEADGALAYIDKAIALDPGFAQAHAQRGALLWVQGKKDEGRSSLERAFVFLPTNPEIIDGYFQSVEGEADTASALKLLEHSRRFFPDHKRLALWHITMLASLGRTGEAATEAASALAAFGVEDSLLATAIALRGATGPLSTPQGQGVTLCMIVKNEERDLPRCLGSVCALVDEIIVVDTGSSDRTPAIAEAMGAQVIRTEWQDDYAAARNAGLRQAHGAWILVLDADEVMAPRDCKLLRHQLASPGHPASGIIFTTRNYVREMDLRGWQHNSGWCEEEAGTGWIGSDKVRLFPNRPDIRFEHAVHEVVEESLQRSGLPLIRTEVPVHHYGRMDAERTRRKAEHYVVIGRRKLAAGKLNDARSLLELAAQEQELGNHAEALPLWQGFLDLHPRDARAELGLGVSLFELGRWPEARVALAGAMAHDPGLREAPVKYSLAALQCGDAKDAREVLTGFCARSPEYPFGQIVLAAALACENRISEAQTLVLSIERRQLHTGSFFRNLSADLLRGGQSIYADRVTVLFSERKTARS